MIPDFKVECLKTNEIYWVEAKGFETDVYRIKRRLWLWYGPGRLEVYKGSAQRVTLFETLVPKKEKWEEQSNDEREGDDSL